MARGMARCLPPAPSAAAPCPERGSRISFNNKADLALGSRADQPSFNPCDALRVDPVKHPHEERFEPRLQELASICQQDRTAAALTGKNSNYLSPNADKR